MKTKYRIGLVYPDGHKCWAVTPPLYKLKHAKAAARMAWLSQMVNQAVVYDNQNKEIIERYDGK
jgi:hypothetical protein